MKALIDINKASVSYPLPEGGRRTILDEVSLKVSPGEFLTVVGPSGCGKSTLLRLVLASQKPDSGQVLVDGKEVSRITKDCGIVYQNYSLFPHLSVLDNIAFGIILDKTNMFERIALSPLVLLDKAFSFFIQGMAIRRGVRIAPMPGINESAANSGNSGSGKSNKAFWTSAFEQLNFFKVQAEAREQALGLLADVGLDPKDSHKYPYELSGGMRQRVSIAQSIMMRPKIILLDEPFGALDARTRESMQDFIHEQWQKHKLTVFFVTHDLDEAAKLGTRLICLSQHWTDKDGKKAKGAKIVQDRTVLGGSMKPSLFKAEQEFQALVHDIGKAGLNPSKPLACADFNLSHPDACPFEHAQGAS